MNSLLRIEHDSDIKWSSQPSKEIVDDFAEGNGTDPALVPMQLAFRYKKKDAWNKCLGEQFFDDFLEREGQICAFKRTSGPSSINYFGSASTTSRRSGKSGRRRARRMIKRFTIVIPQITDWTSSQREETLDDDK
jgi:hypothetical protein